MANRTIGGNSHLNDIETDHLKTQIESSSLAIWDYDESVNHTRRVSPKNLVDAVLGTAVNQDIEDLKRDLGGKREDRDYSSFYYDFNGYTTDETGKKVPNNPTSAYEEVKSLRLDVGRVLENGTTAWPKYTEGDTYKNNAYEWLNKLDSRIKRMAGSNYNLDEGSHAILERLGVGYADQPEGKQNAYDWLYDLQNRVGTQYSNNPSYQANASTWLTYLDNRSGNWPSTVSPLNTKGNAYSWLDSLQTTINGLNDNYLKQKHNRGYGTGMPGYQQKQIPYKGYYITLHPDGNFVVYRCASTSNTNNTYDYQNQTYSWNANRNWVWQSGPEYKPSIFKLLLSYRPASAASTFSSKDITINPASTANITNTGDTWIYQSATDTDTYFKEGDSVILGVKNKSRATNGTATYTMSNLQIKEGTKILITNCSKTLNSTIPLEIEIICCNASNIVDPTNYENL